VPAFLARHKAEQFSKGIKEQLILCADTIVVINDSILNKPADDREAFEMLQSLSGTTHEVITGICLLTNEYVITKTDIAKVMFRQLTNKEIDFYVQSQKPFDKAGAYGIQEWIGMVGIERIEGSYYTIMGLPTHLVYQLLSPYFSR
jgi:septum formation protein